MQDMNDVPPVAGMERAWDRKKGMTMLVCHDGKHRFNIKLNKKKEIPEWAERACTIVQKKKEGTTCRCAIVSSEGVPPKLAISGLVTMDDAMRQDPFNLLP